MAYRLRILAAAVLFGTTGTAQALAHRHAPVEVGAARIVIGGALLATLAAVTGGYRPLRGHGRVVLVSGVGVAVYQLAFFAAVADTGVTVGTVVAIGAAPMLAGLLEWVLERRRPDAAWAGATALAVVGVTLISLAGSGASVSPAGVGLALLASLGYATYAVLGKRLLRAGAGPECVMGACFGVAAVLLVPVLAVTGVGAVTTPAGIGLVLYLGIVPTALAYVLYARGLRGVPASEAATLGLAEPVTAAVLAAAVLGERLGAEAAAGAAIVLLALFALGVPTLLRRPRPAVGSA